MGRTVRFLQHGIPQLLSLLSLSCRGQSESLVGWKRHSSWNRMIGCFNARLETEAKITRLALLDVRQARIVG